jgi:hypothetical protein
MKENTQSINPVYILLPNEIKDFELLAERNMRPSSKVAILESQKGEN